MNIKQAKQEIANALKAYLAKDSLGNYKIPPIRQRPILLMGPPGVGKTQIMEQIAAEAGVGLVSYTITHHTRQSAMGLPFIERRTFGGVERSVTEYTMSEILASVYRLMERTGLREGIVFLDEINCVSETLAPMMLQFLQCKTFGNQRLPEGWLIVAAGNPPEYNKSVRDFDVVTLDRVRRIDVQEDFAAWKEYACRKGLHGAVISYLDIKKENFYRIENSAEGMHFATARGWEDLSELICVYESLGLPVDREVVGQYIQLPQIARDFAGYLELYDKYRKTYHVDAVLAGTWQTVDVSELRAAPFDEKLSVLGLILSRLGEEARAVRLQDALTAALHETLKEFKSRLQSGPVPLTELLGSRRAALERAGESGGLDRERREVCQREIGVLETYCRRLAQAGIREPEKMMDPVREWFAQEVDARRTMGEAAGAQFGHAFRYLEDALGQSQEMAIFVTEVAARYDTSWFVEQFGCDDYFRHSRELLFDDVRRRICGEIAQAAPPEEKA